MEQSDDLSFFGLFVLPRAQQPSVAVAGHVLRKCGEPFLFVPRDSSLAVQALELYPAQTRRARLARSLLRAALRTHVPLPLEAAQRRVALDDPFVQFLCQSAGTTPGEFPPLAILAGNPATDGRRFTLLAFSPSGKPVTVAKAGISTAAKCLIAREEAFLNSVPQKLRGRIPTLRGVFHSGSVAAIALGFSPGDSPRGEVRGRLLEILGSWLSAGGTMALGEIPAWKPLYGHRASYPFLEDLAVQQVVPGLAHGDFAPWNIKVSPRDGNWIVLDWERGELTGVPGWDWFHYEIQTAILVDKCSLSALHRRIDGLLSSASFRSYAMQAHIQEISRPLVAAYLLHCLETVRPTEGLPTLRSLLAAQVSLVNAQTSRRP